MSCGVDLGAEPAFLEIGRRRIGPGQPAYVIAEAGVNHDGELAKALRLVDAAVAARADAVKFQVFRAAELLTGQAQAAEYQKRAGQSDARAMLQRLELEDDALREIRDYCRACEIEFLATPFGLADVRRLALLGVRAIKLASTDLNNVPLVQAAAVTELPLIISTGASTEEEIEAAVARLYALGADGRFALLHCVSCYPAPLELANLRAIETLRRRYDAVTGFSDHTTSAETGAWAVAAGAAILEKHFTLDPQAEGPDHAMSLDPTGLAEYVERVRLVERVLGSGRLGMAAAEADVRRVARRSVVAACDLAAGTRLTAEMLVTKRPAGGIEPERLDELLGCTLRRDVRCDTPLTWDMLR